MDNLPKQAAMLLITSQDWGGAQLYVFELAKELKARGESVVVVAGACHPLHSQGRGQGEGVTGAELSAKCLSSGIDFVELKHISRNINPWANILATIELVKLFRRLKPRTVHLNSTMMGVVGSLAATLTRVPKRIYCIGGWVFNEDLPKWKKSLYVWIERVSAKWKDVIIVVHPGDEELANKLQIKPQEKLITIPNGINIKEFESKLFTREDARGKLGIDAEALIVGTIANAYPPKNLLNYLEVCKKAHEADSRLHFVIIGHGPLFCELQKKRDDLGAQDYVMLTGRRMDAPALYRAFDLFALPSSKEGMSITLLEAMAAQVPIVATDVGAAKWMLGRGAVIVSPGNLDELAEAIVALAKNEIKQKEISRIAREMLDLHFDWNKIVNSTIQLL